jgi:esterase/lipase
MPSYLEFNDQYKISYKYIKRSKKTVIFLHGLLSDKRGTKSQYLANYCRNKNYSFLCFDFRGHGMSSGNFTDYGVGDWYEDLCNMIKNLKINDIILIGSSMGGWIAMLYALRFPKKVKKLIGIAPAPDFTTDLVMKKLTKAEKKRIKMNGIVEKKLNKDFTYKYSPKLFLNSKKHLIKNINKVYKGEVILFHGSEDFTVPYLYNDKFFRNKNFPILINLTIRNADHSMSDNFSLKTISSFI